MPSTAVPNPAWGNDVDAYYGASVTQSFFDLPARRHQMPSIMDSPISPERTCTCPGGPESENSCIDTWDNANDRLCTVCRMYCYVKDENGVDHLFVDLYGTVVPGLPSELVWAANEKRTRLHAWVAECRGCHPSLADHMAAMIPESMCGMATGRTWRALISDEALPRCQTCSKLVAAREAGK